MAAAPHPQVSSLFLARQSPYCCALPVENTAPCRHRSPWQQDSCVVGALALALRFVSLWLQPLCKGQQDHTMGALLRFLPQNLAAGCSV